MSPRWIRASRLAVGAAAVLAVACGSQPEAPNVEAEPVEHAEPAPTGPPTFTADPSWPQPLPNNWALGDVWGVAVDSQDNPWIVHATSDRIQALLEAEGKELAPPIIQFDPEGNILQAWGGPGEGYDWMQDTFAAEHGLFIDHEDNVWVIGGGTRADGGVVLKFTPEGDFLLQIGENGETNGSLDERLLGGPTTAAVHPDTNEVFCRRRLHKPARHRVRRGERRLQAALGRVRDSSRRWSGGVTQSGRSGSTTVGPHTLRPRGP